ncbi:MAG: TetR-like C-terminal domain-containing protein [Actinomycetota bacterium]
MALRLFLDEGGAALTPTRLHKETGVARATIYRNWPEAADLIEIMLGHATEQHPQDLFVGELAHDLQAAVDLLIDRFTHRPARAFFAACVEYGRHSERVAAAATAYVDGILEPFHRVMRRAIDEGLVTGDEDDLVHEIAGPLILEHVVLGRRVTRTRGQALVSRFVAYHGGGEEPD